MECGPTQPAPRRRALSAAIAGALAFAVAGSWIKFRPSDTEPSPSEAEPASHLPHRENRTKSSEHDLSRNEQETPPIEKASPESERPLPLSFPSLETLREEVLARPHDTPPSLLAFASQLAPRMEVALSSAEYAETFFSELESCARGDGTLPPSVLALCAINGSRLARKYPRELSHRYRSLYQTLPEHARSLVDVSVPSDF